MFQNCATPVRGSHPLPDQVPEYTRAQIPFYAVYPSISEAEYTYKLQKTFIPLRLEYKYNPDGWLGIMVGTKLWFDFSVENKFEASLQGLIREIKSKGADQREYKTMRFLRRCLFSK